MKKGIILVAATLMSFVLVIGGAYVTIDNTIHPQGNLFEGIMCLSVGLIMRIVASMVNTLHNTIKLFADIFEQQVEIQTKVQNEINKRNEMSNSPGSGVTFLDMNNLGNLPPEVEKSMEMISKAFRMNLPGRSMKKKLEEMNLEELDAALVKALAKDDFEQATKIRDLIKEKNSPGDSSPEGDAEK